MEDLINVRLWNIPFGKRHQALDHAEHFAKQWPDRVGVSQIVAYSRGDHWFSVYRTKSGQIVVRGNTPETTP